MSLAHKTASPRWELAGTPDFRLVDQLVLDTSLPKNIVKILVNRGLGTPETIHNFLEPSLNDLKDPFEMSGMDLGIDRLTKALYNNEKILIYGDYDVDGITATAQPIRSRWPRRPGCAVAAVISRPGPGSSPSLWAARSAGSRSR